MKVIKKNLPKGVKKQFGKVKGVKVKFVANDKHKKAKQAFFILKNLKLFYIL